MNETDSHDPLSVLVTYWKRRTRFYERAILVGVVVLVGLAVLLTFLVKEVLEAQAVRAEQQQALQFVRETDSLRAKTEAAKERQEREQWVWQQRLERDRREWERQDRQREAEARREYASLPLFPFPVSWVYWMRQAIQSPLFPSSEERKALQDYVRTGDPIQCTAVLMNLKNGVGGTRINDIHWQERNAREKIRGIKTILAANRYTRFRLHTDTAIFRFWFLLASQGRRQ